MLQDEYLLAKIGADIAKSEPNLMKFANMLPNLWQNSEKCWQIVRRPREFSVPPGNGAECLRPACAKIPLAVLSTALIRIFRSSFSAVWKPVITSKMIWKRMGSRARLPLDRWLIIPAVLVLRYECMIDLLTYYYHSMLRTIAAKTMFHFIIW